MGHKLFLSPKLEKPHPLKLAYMHVSSISTCMNFLSQFRSIKFLMTMDHSPCSEREIWLILKGNFISETGEATPTKIGVHDFFINLDLHKFLGVIMCSRFFGLFSILLTPLMCLSLSAQHQLYLFTIFILFIFFTFSPGLLTWFCPCIVIGRNAESVGESKIGCCLGSLLAFYFFWPGYLIIRTMLRNKVRESKGIDVRNKTTCVRFFVYKKFWQLAQQD